MAIDVKADISKFGKGLFTLRSFYKGERIFRFSGQIINFSDTLSLGNFECYTIQIGIDKYINPDAPYCYINHSCEPNCGINASLELIALRDIQDSEELFFDYSTSMLERHWQMDCLCKSPKCRKVIKDFDLLPDEICNKYLEMNIVQPFIIQLLNSKINSTDFHLQLNNSNLSNT